MSCCDCLRQGWPDDPAFFSADHFPIGVKGMDAHEREYLAAAEAVAGDAAPPAEHGPAVGDSIWFKLGDWNYPKSGRVIDTTPLGAVIVITDGGDRHLVWGDEVVRP